MALLSPCFWPEVTRGAERIVREIADGLIERGHRPRLITSHRGRPTTAIEDGLPIVRNYRPPERWLRRRRFEDYLTHAPFTLASLMRGDDDLAHAVFQVDAWAAGAWSRRTKRPVVMTYMGIPDSSALGGRRLRRRILRSVGERATVVALSGMVAEQFRRNLGVDARVIPPSVDLETFAPPPARSDAPTIFCAAPPDIPRKRVGLLVEAFALLRRDRPDVLLRLMRPGAPALAAELLAQPGISLVEPTQEPPRLAREYGRAWATALPSLDEAFGVVLIESLACGTPVVGTDAGAFPEIVDRPEVGGLFAGGAPELARALHDALELSLDAGTARACRARAADFSTARMTDRYMSLYAELLA